MVMFQLLDTTDGTMARSLEINSSLGKLIDDLTGLLFLSFYQMGIAYNIYSFPDYSLRSIINIFGFESFNYSNTILIMGTFSGISALSFRSALQMREKRYESCLQ